MIDFFELAKDVTRAEHERLNLPSPDGVPPSEEARAAVADASRQLRNPPTNPQTYLDMGINI